MNNESNKIIYKHIRPDDSLIAQAKEGVTANAEKKTYGLPLKLATAACLAVLVAVAFATFNREETVIVEQSTEPTETAQYTTNAEGNYLYSDLVDTDTPVDESLSGYSISSCIDKMCFNENLLVSSNCIAIVEATVKNVRLKEYVIVSEFDKFESNGTLTEKVGSIVCEIDISKVWYGALEENQTLIVESQLYSFDEAICIKEGHRYVLPLCDAGDEIAEFAGSGSVISGDLSRESNLGIIYHFQPQIEIIDGGYVFNSLWNTLVCDECVKVTVDMELGEETEFFRDKMLFATTDVFAERMEMLVENLF